MKKMNNSNNNIIPYVKPVPELYQLMTVSSPLLPHHTTNCFVIGEPGHDTLIVDPSPINNTQYANLKNTLNRIKEKNNFEFSAIFITHHHADHLMNAPRLAKEFALPIIISEESFNKISKKTDSSVIESLEISFAGEGDILAKWRGNNVMVFEVPGHAEGQLALAPENMEWFLAGDLIQGAGTVVIGSEDGNMIDYFHSLKRIIRLNPKIVLPSHGKAQHSTKCIKDTLNHRIQREKQVLRLYKAGYTPEQMVDDLYRNVDRRLWPLALENIKSHLVKLKAEQIL